jgi:multimeric flavodoxin WrbA
MGSKLLAIMGSPRRGGNTDVLVDVAMEEFTSRGGQAQKVRVAELDINPCQGCFACMAGDGLETLCTQLDDMTGLYQKLQEADRLIWATPVYMWSPTGQMKLFLDRLFPTGDYQSTRWRRLLAGKRVGFIIVYAEEDPLDSGLTQTRDILKVTAEASGAEVAFTVHSTVGDKGTAKDDAVLVGRVREAAATLVGS